MRFNLFSQQNTNDFANANQGAKATTYNSCDVDTENFQKVHVSGAGNQQHPIYPYQNKLDEPENNGGELLDAKLLQTLAGVAGNALEWYDFALYGYFSDIIAKNFFPQDDQLALLESFVVMGGGFLVRPFGGAIIGYIGDKVGSQRALEISIFLMAFPTFAMGCLPTYSQVGILSPILLIIVRLFQGVSVGGQLMSSLVFTLERQPREKWGFYGSLVMTVATFGCLLGSLAGYIMRALLTDAQLESWGWRIPFLSGIFLSACGFYLSSHEDDSTHDSSAVTPSDEQDNNSNPLKEVFAPKYRVYIIGYACAAICYGGGYYLLFAWMPIFMTDLLIDNPVPGAFGVNTLALFFTGVILTPIQGMAVDRYGDGGSRRFMIVGAWLMILLGPYFTIMISRGEELPAFWAQMALGTFNGLYAAPMCSWLVESSPPEVRITILSIGYNIGLAIGGGLTPVLGTWMTTEYGTKSPGLLFTITALLGLIAVYIVPVGQQAK